MHPLLIEILDVGLREHDRKRIIVRERSDFFQHRLLIGCHRVSGLKKILLQEDIISACHLDSLLRFGVRLCRVAVQRIDNRESVMRYRGLHPGRLFTQHSLELNLR